MATSEESAFLRGEMNTEKLEIGILIYDSHTDMDLTVVEKIKPWEPENRSIYILQCEDLGNYDGPGCRFFAYKRDLADERYQIKGNQPEEKSAENWHDSKTGDLPKNEKTEPKPEKIPGLVWVADDYGIFNLNHVCAITPEAHILHFSFNNDRRSWMFKSDKRCYEIYEKIRAMGAEL